MKEQERTKYNFKPVNPTRPVAAWLGGKRKLANRLIEIINSVPHQCYAEPFIGMGGVFLRRDYSPEVEVINDFNEEIITFFRILQRHYPYFIDMLKYKITSRSDFEKLLKTPPETLLDVERAVRFLYLQRLAFAGKAVGQNFGVSPTTPARFNLTKLVPMLEDVHERLAGVVIERLNYDDFIRRYDRIGTLFYLDPPYFGCENDYGKNIFKPADFERLARLLSDIKGNFILSINDTPEIRAIFSNFNLEEVMVGYSVNAVNQAQFPELIITPKCLGKYEKKQSEMFG